MSNINNTNSDNLLTIGKEYIFATINNTIIALNYGALDSNKHNSRNFVATRTPYFLPHLDFNEYFSHILPYTRINIMFSNPLTSYPLINIITVPPTF